MTWSLASRLVFGPRGLLGRRPAKVALLSTALGVVAMVVAMALMSGYRGELEERLLMGGADLGVYPYSASTAPQQRDAVSRITALPEVASVERVAYAQGTLLGIEGEPGEAASVTLRGVEPGSKFWGRGFDLTNSNEVVLGTRLADTVGVQIGDRARLMLMDVSGSRPKFRYRSVMVADVVSIGYHEFDSSWMVVDRTFLEQVAGVPGSMEVALTPDVEINAARDRIEGALGAGYEVRDFRAPNRALFAALAGQQVLLFLLLGLIVIVATANVASALVVLIRERRRDLGVLSALGMDAGALGRTLFEAGLLLTLVGTTGGLLTGAIVVWALDAFELIKLGDELAAVYFLKAVPFHLRITDLIGVALLAASAGAVASAIPAMRARRLSPARALRAE